MPVVLALSLCACVPVEPDWQAAQEDANSFTSAFDSNVNALGAGSFSAGPSVPPLDDEPALGFEFAETVRIDEISGVLWRRYRHVRSGVPQHVELGGNRERVRDV